jgi:phosphopantothenoylcysteine decarboxylase/phosphopantothenate--cysteine ligase
VRYIANRSSGKQGHAIAEAAARAGADVLLVCGPVAIPDPAGVTCVHVESAREMLAAVEAGLPADIYIGAAAVADWRVGTAVIEKLKKGASGPPSLGLVENPDILATISTHQQRPALVVGFAAETQTVVEHAQAKLKKKKCDLIIANDVSAQSGVMGGDENTVHLVSKAGIDHWPRMAKSAVAQRLVEHLAKLLKEGV